ncbi:MAG: dioxygenase [Aquisalinus sp.]|nr:dioxygenase [Aquisalinus sp.]
MPASVLAPFHLAFPVDDIATAEEFYTNVIGCSVGRSSESWIDFNFFGHQVVAHLSDTSGNESVNLVDGDHVPVRHFGLVLDKSAWLRLRERIERSQTDWMIAPRIRFQGQPGEQGTFFVRDPAGNALEFKFFDDMEQLFAT